MMKIVIFKVIVLHGSEVVV